MNRLTERHYSGEGYYMKCSEFCEDANTIGCGCEQLDKIVARLAAYEDAGLTPEEVRMMANNVDYIIATLKDFTLGRILEVIGAERDGRLVVPPCKVGDTVWLTRWWRGLTAEVQNPPIPRTVQYFRVAKNGIAVHFGDGCLAVEDFGKTVFLTRDEAEVALKEGECDAR